MNRLSDEDYDRLIEALIEVESGGDDNAVGDAGQSFGCLQIGRAALHDFNQAHDFEWQPAENGPWDLEDMFHRPKAKEVCRWYLEHWMNRACSKHPVEPSMEMAARIWNGGPYGFARKTTEPYWEKVRKVLDEQ